MPKIDCCPYGKEVLEHHNSNLCRYSAAFKQSVVSDYLSGGGSFKTIAVKYGIHAESTVLKWVKLYNSHEELTDSRKIAIISCQKISSQERQLSKNV